MTRLFTMSGRTHYVIVFGISALVGAMTLSCSATERTQSYVKTSEILCGSTKVTITTSCSDDSYKPYPTCQKQVFQFELQSLKTKKAVVSPQVSLAKPIGAKESSLDGLASSWACAEGKDQSYVVITFYNGGNCDECEWVEAYDLSGTLLTPSSRKNHKEFQELVNRANLSYAWQKQSRLIKLRRNE